MHLHPTLAPPRGRPRFLFVCLFVVVVVVVCFVFVFVLFDWVGFFCSFCMGFFLGGAVVFWFV